DAGLTASSSARTSLLYPPRPGTSAPWRSAASSRAGIAAARYFPLWYPDHSHTVTSSARDSAEYLEHRGCGRTPLVASGDGAPAPAATASWARRRRVWSRDHPVTIMISSRIHPLSFFLAEA